MTEHYKHSELLLLIARTATIINNGVCHDPSLSCEENLIINMQKPNLERSTQGDVSAYINKTILICLRKHTDLKKRILCHGANNFTLALLSLTKNREFRDKA